MTKKIIAMILVIVTCLLTSGCGETKLWPDRDFCPTEPYSGSIANGDTFYNSDSSHAIFDDGSTVLYFNNLLIAFTYGQLEENEINALANSIDAEVVGIVKGFINTLQFKVKATNLSGIEKLADKLQKNENVMYACPEYPVQIMSTDSDDKNPWARDERNVIGDEKNPGGSDWWAEAIGAYTAWEYIDMCQPINIGVLDSGVDSEHEDLKGQITHINESVVNSTDHGTHVTGIMAALDNDLGIRGIASNADFYCADLWSRSDVNSAESFHTIGELMAYYNYLLQNDVKVINNSWGCYTFDKKTYRHLSEGNTLKYSDYLNVRLTELTPTAKAVIAMISQIIESGKDDVIFVTAAGNDAVDCKYSGFFAMVSEDIYDEMAKQSEKLATYKDIDERIFIVGAISNDKKDDKYKNSEFTSYGDTIDIFAPGVEIFSTVNAFDDIYGSWDGTSMSSPIVCASIAYVWSIDPSMTVTEVRELILSTATSNIILDKKLKNSGTPELVINLGAAVEKLADSLDKSKTN